VVRGIGRGGRTELVERCCRGDDGEDENRWMCRVSEFLFKMTSLHLIFRGRKIRCALGCFLLVATLGVVMAWILTIQTCYQLVGTDRTWYGQLGNGSIYLVVWGSRMPRELQIMYTPGISKGTTSLPSSILPSIQVNAQGTKIDTPLWLWTVVFGIPAIVLLVSCVKSRRNDHDCTLCGYNLTGNTSGRCPECGTEISEKQKAAGLSGSRAEATSR
jgi:predicted RNA-binding Zn-ribbon protein involved in translation (DUF1610 family)